MSNPFTSWPLIDGGTETAPQTVPPTGPKAIPTKSAEFAPFGYGLIRPFKRDQKSDFAAGQGAALVIAAMGQILGTVASSEFSQGELPWRPEFGSLIHLLRHRPNTAALDELAHQYIIDALARWERRIVITDSSVDRSFDVEGGLNSLTIRVRFNFVDLASSAVVFRDLETSITI